MGRAQNFHCQSSAAFCSLVKLARAFSLSGTGNDASNSAVELINVYFMRLNRGHIVAAAVLNALARFPIAAIENGLSSRYPGGVALTGLRYLHKDRDCRIGVGPRQLFQGGLLLQGRLILDALLAASSRTLAAASALLIFH